MPILARMALFLAFDMASAFTITIPSPGWP